MIDRIEVKEHFNRIAAVYDGYKIQNLHYYDQLKKLIHDKTNGAVLKKVLEIGCGTGSLLNIVPCKFTVGGDISIQMIRQAKSKSHQSMKSHFIVMAAEEIPFKPVFDFVIAIDLMEHVTDQLSVLQELYRCSKPGTKILVSTANPIWTYVLHYAEKKHRKMPEGPHQWPSMRFLKKAGLEAGFDIIECGYRYLIPFPVAKVGDLINKFFHRIPLLKRLGLIQYIIFIRKLNKM